ETVNVVLQFGRGGRTGGGDGGTDSSRPVALAFHAGHELVTAVTGKNEVGVAVDKTGDDGPSISVHAVLSSVGAGGRRPRPGHPAPFDDQCGVIYYARRPPAYGHV